MRFSIIEKDSGLSVTSPDLPGWSVVVHGRDHLWVIIGYAFHRMDVREKLAAYRPADDDRRHRSVPGSSTAERRTAIKVLFAASVPISTIAELLDVTYQQITGDLLVMQREEENDRSIENRTA